MTTNIITLDSVQQFKNSLKEYSRENPVESAIYSNILKKAFDEIEKDCKSKAVDYWQANKELPLGFRVEERNSPKKYHFEENEEWVKANEQLEAIEAKLKKASDSKIDGQCLVDETTGEILPTVTVDVWWVIYAFKK